jgi:hypothetical protein
MALDKKFDKWIYKLRCFILQDKYKQIKQQTPDAKVQNTRQIAIDNTVSD